MDVPDYLHWPMTQNLAYRLVEKLDAVSQVEDSGKREIHVKGFLPLANEEFSTKKKALCAFDVDFQWLRRMPRVTCQESWVKQGQPDWHVDKNGGLCFEFTLHWMQELTAMIETYSIGPTADYAVAWLLNSSRSLLNRHLFAFRNGIQQWPRGWTFWPHGVEPATREYELEKVN